MSADKAEFVSLASVASSLGASKAAVRCWLETAGIAAFAFGAGKNARLSYRLEDVNSWIDESKETDDDFDEEEGAATDSSGDSDEDSDGFVEGDDVEPDVGQFDDDDDDDQAPDDDDQDLDEDADTDDEADLDEDDEADLVDDSCANPSRRSW